MLKSERDKLRELASKATPGPWGFSGESCTYHIARVETSTVPDPSRWGLTSKTIKKHLYPRIVLGDWGNKEGWSSRAGGVAGWQDAAYIAAADPSTIIALLNYIDQLERSKEKPIQPFSYRLN